MHVFLCCIFICHQTILYTFAKSVKGSQLSFKGHFFIFSFPKMFHILKQKRKDKENRALEKEGELCIWDPIDMVSFKLILIKM